MHFPRLNIILIIIILIIAGGLAGGYLYMKGVFYPPISISLPPVAVDPQDQLTNKALNQGGVKKFKDYAELQAFLKKHSSVTSSAYYGGMDLLGRGMMKSATMMDSVGAPSANALEIGGGPDYSKTNIQVEGVDEADIVKTDGKYIYALKQNIVYIISAVPAEKSEIVSEIKFASSSPAGLFISGDKLAVYGSDWGAETVSRDSAEGARMMFPIRGRQPSTFLKVYDIADKKNPVLKRDLSFDGYYSNSRMIGDYIYFVTSVSQYDYAGETYFLPRILENGVPISAGKEMPVYYFNIPYRSQTFVTISGVNLNDPGQSPVSEAYLLDGNQEMYVSQNNIYITYTRYVDEYQLTMETVEEIVLPRLSAKNQELIHKIEAADIEILSDSEKQQKIMVIIQSYMASLSEDEQKAITDESKNRIKQKYEDLSKELEKTVIHKIAISGGKIAYQVAGEVTGHILNQFSMDEDNGYFRIATTKSPSWSMFSGEDNAEQKSYNNLYILDSNLKATGKVENLATDERIYSVRFMQGRAYMVTAKQTDPLFVIDVSNPTEPKVLGELKIPGFSTYLHPYDDKTLIGIGKETEEIPFVSEGRDKCAGELGVKCAEPMIAPAPRVVTKGLKISLFDVSDTANPKETAHYSVEGQWSDSSALYDHKAFLFSKEKNLLVIPVIIQGDYEIQSSNFAGAYVFNIAKDTVALKGKIAHPNKQADFGFNAEINRSLYIENTLFTLSDGYLGVSDLANLSSIKNIEFKREARDEVSGYSPAPLPAQIME